jgi:hypothetical protein
MKNVAIGVLVAVAGASAASADVTYNFTNQTWTGFNFSQLTNAGDLSGMLSSVSVDAVLLQSISDTWADDLTIYLDELPLSTAGALQVGGFSNLGAGQRYFWPNGGAPDAGTPVMGTVALTTPIDIAAYPVWLGNGYGAAGTSGTWTGSITLHGVNLVPAPGALGLVGAGGLMVARRRRR